MGLHTCEGPGITAGEPEEGDSRYLSHELLLPHDKLVQLFSGTAQNALPRAAHARERARLHIGTHAPPATTLGTNAAARCCTGPHIPCHI